MNETEASTLVARLVAFFPGVRFDLDNAKAYEHAIMDLSAREAEQAIESVVTTALFLPPIAAIRAEAMRQRKLDRDRRMPARLSLPGSGTPSPGEWATLLASLLESSARHQRMAEPWYAARGKKPPPDPAQVFVDLAQAGARGEDVQGRLKREVLGYQDDSERRYP